MLHGIKNPILVAAKLEDDKLYNTGIKAGANK
jgi:hypothetical protein